MIRHRFGGKPNPCQLTLEEQYPVSYIYQENDAIKWLRNMESKEERKTKLKIVIIGSHQYKEKFLKHKEELEKEGHEVRIPAFDDHPDLDDLGVCEHNRDLIRWADRIDMIWDQRSLGTILDFGMLFMAEKPLHIVYLEPKTLRGVMEKYEKIGKVI